MENYSKETGKIKNKSVLFEHDLDLGDIVHRRPFGYQDPDPLTTIIRQLLAGKGTIGAAHIRRRAEDGLRSREHAPGSIRSAVYQIAAALIQGDILV